MLHLFCILSLVVAQVLATPRYIIGVYEASYLYAYPLDICLTTGALSGKEYVKYVCSADNTTITRYNYSLTDTTCSKTVVSETVITAADETAAGLNQFNCDGTNDYAVTNLYINCRSTPSAYLYTALNVCYYQKTATNNSSREIYTHTQCNSTGAVLATYYSTGSCDLFDSGVSLQNESSISTSCAYYTTQASFKIYAKLTSCVYNGYSQLPVTTNNSASITGSKKTVGEVNLTLALTTEQYTSDPNLCGYDWVSFFENYFDNSYVEITSYCNANDGVGYAGMNFVIRAIIYKGTSLSVSSVCSTYSSAITSSIQAIYPSVTVSQSITCSSSNTSSGSMLQMYGASTIAILIAMIMFVFN